MSFLQLWHLSLSLILITLIPSFFEGIIFPRPFPVSFYLWGCMVVTLMIQALNTHHTQVQKQLCQRNPWGGSEAGLRNLKRGTSKVREMLLQNGKLCSEQAKLWQNHKANKFWLSSGKHLLCYCASISLQRGIYRAFIC